MKKEIIVKSEIYMIQDIVFKKWLQKTLLLWDLSFDRKIKLLKRAKTRVLADRIKTIEEEQGLVTNRDPINTV